MPARTRICHWLRRNHSAVRRAAEAAASADIVIAFSVFTHLLHEECYAYLQDAARVLTPGGKFVFSFFEFDMASRYLRVGAPTTPQIRPAASETI
jgi:cyclopropane fatty-acyl-phospholipid synthase-like methyltransferase